MAESFVNRALGLASPVAGFASDILYNQMGGSNFAAAARRNAAVQRRQGLLKSYFDPTYWSEIAKGTAKFGANVLPFPVAGAGLKVASKVPNLLRAQRAVRQKLPPSIAPNLKAITQRAEDRGTQYVQKYQQAMAKRNPYVSPETIAAEARKNYGAVVSRSIASQVKNANEVARQAALGAAKSDLAKASSFFTNKAIRKTPVAAGISSAAVAGATLGVAAPRTRQQQQTPARAQASGRVNLGNRPLGAGATQPRAKKSFSAAASGKNTVRPAGAASVSTGTSAPRVTSQAQAGGIPSRTTPAVTQQGGKYTVRSGDTLSSIAQRNNTTVANIIKNNPKLTQNKKYKGGNVIFSGTPLKLGGGR